MPRVVDGADVDDVVLVDVDVVVGTVDAVADVVVVKGNVPALVWVVEGGDVNVKVVIVDVVVDRATQGPATH